VPPVGAWTRSGRFDALLDELEIERLPARPADDWGFVLFEGDAGLELRPPGELGRAGIRARFPPDRASASSARGRRPFDKAFGRKIHRIFDLTAGLGADAYRLAAAGYAVEGCERNPVVYALLASGWDLVRETDAVPCEIAGRLRFEWSEGETMLERIESQGVGVYLDPMYPVPRRRSALPKRPLQILRGLIGEAGDTSPLLALARERAARVVVKRPPHAPPLMDDVGFTVETKLIRLDVYLNPERMERSA
jgi:16S rRNA (guanine1516-N2)-methyltransferase